MTLALLELDRLLSRPSARPAKGLLSDARSLCSGALWCAHPGASWWWDPAVRPPCWLRWWSAGRPACHECVRGLAPPGGAAAAGSPDGIGSGHKVLGEVGRVACGGLSCVRAGDQACELGMVCLKTVYVPQLVMTPRVEYSRSSAKLSGSSISVAFLTGPRGSVLNGSERFGRNLPRLCTHAS